MSDTIKKLIDHVRASIDKDNDWGPCEWEAWNETAKRLLEEIDRIQFPEASK